MGDVDRPKLVDTFCVSPSTGDSISAFAFPFGALGNVLAGILGENELKDLTLFASNLSLASLPTQAYWQVRKIRIHADDV